MTVGHCTLPAWSSSCSYTDTLCIVYVGICICCFLFFFFFSSRRRHTRWNCDWSSDVCSSDLLRVVVGDVVAELAHRELLVPPVVRDELLPHDVAPLERGNDHRVHVAHRDGRSEERRVGKECRSRWGGDH